MYANEGKLFGMLRVDVTGKEFSMFSNGAVTATIPDPHQVDLRSESAGRPTGASGPP